MRNVTFLVLALSLGGCSATMAPSSTPSPSLTAATTPIATASPRPTPTPVLGAPCPDPRAPSIFELQEADPECFQGDINLTGWLDTPPPMGFEGPRIEPAWLYYPADNFASLWSEKPLGNEDHGCPETSTNCAWIFLHVAPGSGVELGAFGRFVDVVGHLHDPASATCHYEYPDDPEENPYGSPPEDGLAAQCARNFVVTQVEALGHD